MADDDLVFVIDGEDCPMPDIPSLTMGERRVMFELSGIIQEDFQKEDDENDAEHQARLSRMTRHPGFMESLMHISYQRMHPELKRAKVQQIIDGTRFSDAIEKWGDVDVDDADPPASGSTSAPGSSSPTGSVDSNVSSGSPLSNGSAGQDAIPVPTGTTR